jgi:hypothetical protein
MAEREVLLTILSYCGVLKPRRRPAFWKELLEPHQHIIPPAHEIDWKDPVAWLRGEAGSVTRRADSGFLRRSTVCN